jgi:DNA-directed RNA polymerase specialized sigma24 family protein
VADPYEEEFLDFYRAYWSRLVAALGVAVPHGEDPADVAQESFARAYEHWSVVRVHPRPDAWLFLTGYRLAGTLRRRLRTAVRRQRLQAPIPSEVVGDALLGELIDALPPRQRAALLLRHYYGLSTKETAAYLRCPEGTVKSLVARGLSTLRLAAEEEQSE